MNDMKFESGTRDRADTPRYVRPQITMMKDEEVLKAFQMTAVEISAAGCWWMPPGGGGGAGSR
jgi:hypothetical protein